MTVDWC